MANKNNSVDYKTLAQWLIVIIIAIIGYYVRSYDVRLGKLEDNVSQIMRVVCPLDGTEVAVKPSNTTPF